MEKTDSLDADLLHEAVNLKSEIKELEYIRTKLIEKLNNKYKRLSEVSELLEIKGISIE